MKIVEINNDSISVSLNLDQLLIIHCALNEVVNGLDVFEFETRIGSTLEEVGELQKKINEIIDSVELNKLQSNAHGKSF
ncbi:hypothetical protein [Variovorax sp. PvP013]|uniref:hypothetical protein n=1 Tax=Variovorax sp. PvP013 TaxID=3156435 RepID=UPI003D23998A